MKKKTSEINRLNIKIQVELLDLFFTLRRPPTLIVEMHLEQGQKKTPDSSQVLILDLQKDFFSKGVKEERQGQRIYI